MNKVKRKVTSKTKSKVKKAGGAPVRKSKKQKFKEHPVSSSEIFSSREIGWLNFNLRVLAEARDMANPIFERIKFLAISSSNLDEFFMKRVGGIKRQIAYGLTPKSSDGQTPKKQLAMIARALEPMLKQQLEVYNKLRTDLQRENVYIQSMDQLSDSQRQSLKKYFLNHVYPILTPLSVDPGHPFPFISNLSTSLGVSLVQEGKDGSDEKIFARVKIPKLIDQWVQIDDSQKYIHIIDIVRSFVNELFPNMKVMGTLVFKVTRNADSDREEEDAEDLLATMEEELRQRRFAEIVRIEYGHCTDEWLKSFLVQELSLKTEDIHPLLVDFDFSDLQMLVQTLASELPQENTRYTAWSPVVPAVLQEQTSIFSVIDKQDILLHHPFESFSASVERFVAEASDDPMVLAIKMTLYRTGDNSPFIKSLIRAAENGKQVVCLIELKARFDEERNIYWAQELENAGVHVVYGLVGLKTHAKTTLIVRKHGDDLKTYAHIGTGNYNVVTSRFYTDVGLLTCHPEITSELVAFFNYLTGKSLKKDYQHLLIAPVNMFQKFKDLIRREVNHSESGRPALIMAKFNNMEENDISLALYAASQYNVQIQLIVRGFCCLRPEHKAFSKNIKVQSTLGRFLEHSRIFYFRNGQADPIDGDFYIGSADWMYRNLHARVEAICPVYDRQAKEKLWDILQTYWQDRVQSWSMNSDGNYVKKKKQPNDVGVQQLMMEKSLVKTNLTEDDFISSDDEESAN